MRTKTKKGSELTLKDRLSRLTYHQAVKLLGEEGPQLIRQGGKYEVDIYEQVFLGDDLFRLTLPEAVVTLTLMASARQRLLFNCNQCSRTCEHVGAAFSLILEEKTSLGLAEPPPEREPVTSLSDEEITRIALEERAERAREEKMTSRSMDPSTPWADYLVTNATSGKTYRVALRGMDRGASYCSCPDFRKNTLGTCKHILNVQAKVKRRFPASRFARPPTRRKFTVHLRYGENVELRIVGPKVRDESIEAIVRPLRDRPIKDLQGFLRRVRRLAAAGRDVLIYPDAEEYIQQCLFRERMQSRVAEIRADTKNHPFRKSLLKVELLPYQLDGIAFALGAGRAILADDMGLGKTIQGVGLAELLAREAGISRVLIVCPASVKSQWRAEIRRFSDRDEQIVLGSAKTRHAQYASDRFFTICNYEQVLRDILAIEAVKWDLIILDEAQRIKNWEAKTTRMVKGLKSPFALALSGTPLENRLDDLFSVVEFIDDRRLGPAFRFYNAHRIVDEKGKVLGYKKLSELRERLKPVLLRRTRASVMPELPPRSTEIIRVEPTDEQHEMHQGWMQVVSTIVGKKFINEMDLLRLQKALLMCRMTADSTYLVNKEAPGYSTKLEKLDELLCQLRDEEDRKIVVFSEWTTMLNFIQEILDKRELSYVRLDGSVPQKKRLALVHQFQNDRDCKVFLATNAGATGLNLQAANTVINVDLPWNPAVLEQRIGRAHRMGQKRSVQVFVLVTEQTIEENLLRTLSAKHELATAALEFDSEVDEVSIATGMEELKKRLEILLGAQPEAPLDVSEKRLRDEEGRRLARSEKVASAGGQLLSSVFTFLQALLPEQEESEQSKQMADTLKKSLSECVTQDERGRPKLTITLPDDSALENMTRSLAALLTGKLGGPAKN